MLDCQGMVATAKLATELHREIIIIPYMVRFVVFARHHTYNEARLRIVCTAEEKIDKALENKEKFVEVARSREVEVFQCLRKNENRILIITFFLLLLMPVIILHVSMKSRSLLMNVASSAC